MNNWKAQEDVLGSKSDLLNLLINQFSCEWDIKNELQSWFYLMDIYQDSLTLV